MRNPEPVYGAGRERPYVTLVDTGLAMAIQNFIAELWLRNGEGDVQIEGVCWDEVQNLANRLAIEIQDRSF